MGKTSFLFFYMLAFVGIAHKWHARALATAIRILGGGLVTDEGPSGAYVYVRTVTPHTTLTLGEVTGLRTPLAHACNMGLRPPAPFKGPPCNGCLKVIAASPIELVESSIIYSLMNAKKHAK